MPPGNGSSIPVMGAFSLGLVSAVTVACNSREYRKLPFKGQTSLGRL